MFFCYHVHALTNTCWYMYFEKRSVLAFFLPGFICNYVFTFYSFTYLF
jgi:hypothetical protein